MLYGLIGEHLTHSYSLEIHKSIAEYKYELKELSQGKLPEFLQKKEFLGINVTIPYKESVIPYLDSICETASRIGAVNTVVNRDGKLCGYNTDCFGMKLMLEKHLIQVKNKKVLILGTGGTSKTAAAVSADMGAGEIIKVSRTSSDGAVSYADAVKYHSDAQVIINTTPVGMYPKSEEKPIDISHFKSLTGVADVIYNPLCTSLVLDAKKRGIPCCNGLYMLAAQAVYASALFQNKEPDPSLIDKAYTEVLKSKRNIVLIGMPSSGKSSVGKALAEALGAKFFDSDSEITSRIGMPIFEYFEKCGEKSFRDIEKQVILELSKKSSVVIATGGGAVLDSENVENLKKNGVLVFLDRSLENLISTSDRPLSSNFENLKALFEKRYGIYLSASDIRIDGNGNIPETVKKIIQEI